MSVASVARHSGAAGRRETRAHTSDGEPKEVGNRPSVGVPETLDGTALDPAVYLFNYFQFSSETNERGNY